MLKYDQSQTAKYVKKDWIYYLNVINALDERKNNVQVLTSKPFVLYLDPTSFCNLQCPFCTTGQRTGARPADSMSFSSFKNTIDQIGENLFHISFYNWGEPLLNKDFVEMVQYIQKYHITSDISTNLNISLNQEKAESLINSGLDLILMSVDGITQETYQKYRVGGNLELALKNMKLLADAKRKLKNDKIHLLWRFFVFKHNQHEIEKARMIADEIGIEIQMGTPFVDPEKYDEYASTITEYAPQYWPYASDVKNSDDNPYSTKTPIERKSNRALKKLDFPVGCDWLWSTMAINANGSVSPCCVTPLAEQDFGHTDKNNLIQIWNNEKYRNARNLTSDKDFDHKLKLVCENCPSLEVWHVPDWCLIMILKGLLMKLPPIYGDMKNISVNDIDWKTIEKLKMIILREMHVEGLEKIINEVHNSFTWKILRVVDRINRKIKHL